jgi:hypothetical protein
MIRRFGSALCLGLLAVAGAHAATVIPAGNRSVEQPMVPGGSASRTKALKTSYDAKYRKVIALLRNDKALRRKIVEAARQFGISPLHIAGAIVGEHTYNVDAYDRLQTYYVKAVSYLSSSFSFSYEGEDIGEFIQRPEFAACQGLKDSYSLWTCREDVWNASFRGQNVGGRQYPNNRFSAVFFQPFYAGQTFGIGQLNPLTALQMSDTVARVAGMPKLDYRDPQSVYRSIMDPDQTLRRRDAAQVDRRLQIDRGIRHLAESRPDRDAVQCRRAGSPRTSAEGREREARGGRPGAETARRKLLRLAGQRPHRRHRGAVLERARPG